MSTKKMKKTTKGLRKGKKLEATKPLQKSSALSNVAATGTHIKEATVTV
jgi:hypothetical protein